MLELIIVVLLVLWLLGYTGRATYPFFTGSLVHLILVVAVIVLVVRLLS